jgi:hypothetical protein
MLFSVTFCLEPLTGATYISGTVRNSTGVAIQDAVVEVWDNDAIVGNTTTNAAGFYNISGLQNAKSYMVRAYQLINLSPIDDNDCSAGPNGFSGFMAKAQTVMTPQTANNYGLVRIPVLNIDYYNTGTWMWYYGIASNYQGNLLRRGDVMISRDPQGVLNGVAVVCWRDPDPKARGMYSLNAFADDTSTTGVDEGAVNGDKIVFYVNNVTANITTGDNTFDTNVGYSQVELSTTGTASVCQFEQSRWNQNVATINAAVTINISTQGCPSNQLNVTIIEGGNMSRGRALLQPSIIALDLLGQAVIPWTAEWINDTGGTDSNPPEYYFYATVVGNSSIFYNSSLTQDYLSVYPDTIAPSVTNVNLAYFGDDVFVNWDTNEPSTAQIDWGPTVSYGQIILNTSLTLAHTVLIQNLNLNSTYYYRITSRDQYTNANASYESSFFMQSPATIVLFQGFNNYYYGVQDTYLLSLGDIDVGGAGDLRAGQRDVAGNFSIPILQFSLSSLPTNITILSARLELTYYFMSEAYNPLNFSAYRVLKRWTAGNGSGTAPYSGIVTYNYANYSSVLWGMPGADQTAVDREANSQSSLVFNSGTPEGNYSWSLNPSLVAAWIANSSSNNGILIKSNVTTLRARYFFRSSDFGIVDQRPKLIITFLKGASGASCALQFDATNCGCISSAELANAINAWYTGSITSPVLIDHIRQWKICSSA